MKHDSAAPLSFSSKLILGLAHLAITSEPFPNNGSIARDVIFREGVGSVYVVCYCKRKNVYHLYSPCKILLFSN